MDMMQEYEDKKREAVCAIVQAHMGDTLADIIATFEEDEEAHANLMEIPLGELVGIVARAQPKPARKPAAKKKAKRKAKKKAKATKKATKRRTKPKQASIPETRGPANGKAAPPRPPEDSTGRTRREVVDGAILNFCRHHPGSRAGEVIDGIGITRSVFRSRSTKLLEDKKLIREGTGRAAKYNAAAS